MGGRDNEQPRVHLRLKLMRPKSELPCAEHMHLARVRVVRVKGLSLRFHFTLSVTPSLIIILPLYSCTPYASSHHWSNMALSSLVGALAYKKKTQGGGAQHGDDNGLRRKEHVHIYLVSTC